MKRIFLIFFLIFILTIKGFVYDPINECVNYIKAQDYQRAITARKTAVSLLPRSVEAYCCLGRAYMMIGEFNRAFESFKKAELYASSKMDLIEIYNNKGNNISVAPFCC